MGFDDLAKHMASRDGKKKLSGGSAEQIMADAAVADQKMSRTRDLILGPILLVGGAIGLFLIGAYLYDALNPHPSPLRPPETGNTVLVPVGVTVLCGAAIIRGLLWTIRGLRNRSP